MIQSVKSDANVRARIGPWSEHDLPSLDTFEMDRNFVVRAAAGSGKTTTLVARMVALVRRGVDVRSIAAITFTRKAAAEMQYRFRRELALTHGRLPEGSEKEAVGKALGDVRQGFVGTIDAFCARILRAHALAMGVPPDFTAGLDKREERYLRKQALEAYLGEIHADAPERLLRLEEMGMDLSRLPTFFDTLCEYPELELYTDGPAEAPNMDSAVEESVAMLEHCRSHWPDSLDEGMDNGMRAFERASGMLRQGPFQTSAAQAAFLTIFEDVIISKNGKEKADFTLKCWASRSKQKEAYGAARDLAKDTLPAFVNQVVRPPLRQWNALVHRSVCEVMAGAVGRYRDMRREQGKLTFNDVKYYTRELLRSHPRLRESIQQQYHRFLVDEFQDTDPLQTEILFYLTGEDPNEEAWDRCIPKPGSLFIVGDDKQSIYRFRRADKDVFQKAAKLISETGGQVVDLTRNFRSLGAVCRWCNDAFGTLFCDDVVGDIQAEYVPLEAHRPHGADAHGIRFLEIDKKKGNAAALIARDDAAKIAQFISAACNGKCDDMTGSTDAVFGDEAAFSDFMILTRTRTRLQIYADALAARGIPYAITGSRDLEDSPQLHALVELLSCARRPDDPVAAVAYLRGGLCGFSDDDLYRYHQAGGVFDQMLETLPEEASNRLDDALAKRASAAIQRVQKARAVLAAHRPSLAIEQVIDEMGLWAAAAHPGEGESGSLRAGQLLRALELVRELAGEGKDWPEIVEELRLVVQGEERMDGMTLETGTGGAVRLMNVHQAKGLEAPVVFLADPYSSGGGNHKPEKYVLRDAGQLAVPVIEGENFYVTYPHAPLAWHDSPEGEPGFEELERRHETAERQRLLYVAATRAKNLLVVSTYSEKKDAGYWSDLYAALDAATVPPLIIPDAGEPAGAQLPAPNLAAEREEREKRVSAMSSRSYILKSVTHKDEDEHEPFEPLGDQGYGKEFGIAFHALVELLVTHRSELVDPEEQQLKSFLPWKERIRERGKRPVNRSEQSTASIDYICRQHELPEEAVDRLHAMASELLRSDFWQVVLRAEEAYAEYPLMKAAGAVLTSGSADLIYRTGGGWHIVDFKTDQIDEARLAQGLPSDHSYVRQVKTYAAAWKSATGEPVAKVGLWFADAACYLAVETQADARTPEAPHQPDLFPQS